LQIEGSVPLWCDVCLSVCLSRQHVVCNLTLRDLVILRRLCLVVVGAPIPPLV